LSKISSKTALAESISETPDGLFPPALAGELLMA
jgi:hypothetical protein